LAGQEMGKIATHFVSIIRATFYPSVSVPMATYKFLLLEHFSRTPNKSCEGSVLLSNISRAQQANVNSIIFLQSRLVYLKLFFIGGGEMVANTSFLSQAKTVFPRSFYNEI
jgi:hypothetical protein